MAQINDYNGTFCARYLQNEVSPKTATGADFGLK